MNELDFEIKYKKGVTMPAVYQSRNVIAALNDATASTDPFIPDLHAKDTDLINIQYHLANGSKWPLNTIKYKIRRLLPIATSIVNENDTIWVRHLDHDYPRTLLFLQQIYRKGILKSLWIYFFRT